MNTRASLFAVILVLLVLTGCARTHVTSVWRRAGFSGPPMRSLIVLAQTGSEYDRSAWEQVVVERYRGSGMQAVAAVTVFPDSSKAGIDRVISHARQRGIDGVLVIRHTGTRNVETYHPPEVHYYYDPGWYYPYRGGYYRGYYGPYLYPRYRWYDPYYPYYYDDYDVVVTPAYTSYHRVVMVESYLYQSATGEQVWSMSTETLDPLSEYSLVADISRSTFRNLLRYRLISRTR